MALIHGCRKCVSLLCNSSRIFQHLTTAKKAQNRFCGTVPLILLLQFYNNFLNVGCIGNGYCSVRVYVCSPKFYKKICLVYGNAYGNLSYRQSFLWKCVLLLVSLVICVVLNIIGIFEFVKILVCVVAVAIDFNNTDGNV